MTDLPPRPACFGHFGLLPCNCKGSVQCAADREFWNRARTVELLPTNPKRTEYVTELARKWPAPSIAKLKRAAMELIKERENLTREAA